MENELFEANVQTKFKYSNCNFDCSILKKVCDILGVPVTQVQTKSRKRELVWARKIYVYLRWKYEWYYQPYSTRTTLSKIGMPVLVEHCTVLHYKRIIQGEMETYIKVFKEIRKIEHILLTEGLLKRPEAGLPLSEDEIRKTQTELMFTN